MHGINTYAGSIFSRLCDEVRTSNVGERNNQLNKSSYIIGRMVAAKLVDSWDAEAELVRAAMDAGLPEKEARLTINSGINNGSKNPMYLTRGNEDRAPAKNITELRAKARKKFQTAPELRADPQTEFLGTWWPVRDEPQNGKRFQISWSEMESKCSSPKDYASKEAVPQWSLCTFKNDYRKKVCHEGCYGLVVDVDQDPTLSSEDIRKALLGIAYIAHTSWSHAQKKAKWRVIVPTARPISADEYRHLEAWLAELFPGMDVRGPYQGANLPANRPGYEWDSQRPGEAGVTVLDPDKILNRDDLLVLSCPEMLAVKLPQRKSLLTPVIKEGQTAMIHGWRGTGKSFFVQALAVAVASGSKFLDWHAEQCSKVLLIDGEMSGHELQERIQQQILALGADPGDNLRILANDFQKDYVSIPNLGSLEGQIKIEKHLKDVDLVIIDNLSCLCNAGPENEAESWAPVQEWLRDIKKTGLSVILVHHSGKSGLQRGTSKREDILDLVLGLKRPMGYQERDGARFVVNFEKSRGLYGASVEPFEVALQADQQGQPLWTHISVELSIKDLVVRLHDESYSVREISEEIGRSKSQVQRILKECGVKERSTKGSSDQNPKEYQERVDIYG